MKNNDRDIEQEGSDIWEYSIVPQPQGTYDTPNNGGGEEQQQSNQGNGQEEQVTSTLLEMATVQREPVKKNHGSKKANGSLSKVASKLLQTSQTQKELTGVDYLPVPTVPVLEEEPPPHQEIPLEEKAEPPKEDNEPEEAEVIVKAEAAAPQKAPPKEAKSNMPVTIVAIISVFCAVGLIVSLLAVSLFAGKSDTNASGMMKKTPSNVTMFDFVDVKTLRNDEALQSTYNLWRGEMGTQLQELGIQDEDVNSWSTFLILTYGDIDLIQGNFQQDTVMLALDLQGYTRDNYGETTIWKKDSTWVTFIEEDTIAMGSREYVMACLNVANGETDPLSDSEVFNGVMHRLPSGFAVTLYDSSRYYGYAGLQAAGGCLSSSEDSTVSFTRVFAFDTEKRAEDARYIMARNTDVEAEADGEYVEATTQGKASTIISTPGAMATSVMELSWELDLSALQSQVATYFATRNCYPTNSGNTAKTPVIDNYPSPWGDDIGDSCIVFSGNVLGQSRQGLADLGFVKKATESSIIGGYGESNMAKNPGGTNGHYCWYIDSLGSIHSWYDVDNDDTVDNNEIDFISGVYP